MMCDDAPTPENLRRLADKLYNGFEAQTRALRNAADVIERSSYLEERIRAIHEWANYHGHALPFPPLSEGSSGEEAP